MECNLEPITVSMAYVYFEKLVLQGKLNKQNRKLCAGACVLLAAKISSDLRKHEVKHLIDVSTAGISSRVSNSLKTLKILKWFFFPLLHLTHKSLQACK